ncbi:DUF4230 domain-containing protein [Robertkochia solimangrovi]|uniref:DUF4230 domain-containing protein n=1 Tax=Robertkochia solimangrovi TaxID=2213046 RepID=UPI00117D2C5B|nr:DUF4230 domain-containing protein [Robertkochia solimangrovi]TRZ43101.1 hypothetical protein DMZ48_10415 [Robertkochia solimangrovi]
MRKILIGVVITLMVVFMIRSCEDQLDGKRILSESSMLIRNEIENVSKLVVTEGHFAEVFNYRESENLFGNLITTEKKALVVVNAEVAVSYDLSQLGFQLDSLNKVLRITTLPDPEIRISPDLEYYDVQGDYLNPFDADDYNAIKNKVNASLRKKIERSNLVSNAENRLLSELSGIYVLTNSLGWTLEYQDRVLSDTTLKSLPVFKN